MNKAVITAAIAIALFSGTALAVSGNPENPDASTKNWQLNELRQSMNSQFSDVNNRIDQIQAGSSFDASGIYEHLERHDNQIDVLNSGVANAQNIANTANDKANQAVQKNTEQDGRLDALDKGLNDTNKRVDVLIDHSVRLASEAMSAAQKAQIVNRAQDSEIAELQDTKADRSELEEVAIKADGALAGSIENRNQIDTVKENLADTNKHVADNKASIDQLHRNDQALADNISAVDRDVQEVKQQANNNKQDIQKVKNDVKVVSRDVANNSLRIQRNEERIDGAYAGIYDNRKNIEANRQAVNRNSQEIQKLNKNFSDLKNTVDANRKRAAAGIAGVAAMANIPEVNSHQTFSLGVGVGGFDGQQAVAVGASARVNNNLTVKASVAANNEEVVWGAGAAIGW